MEQRLGFTRAAGNLRIAYGLSGEGPPLVRVGTWLTHLHHDWDSPIWRHWFEYFSADHTLVRYDPRGCGLSQREQAQVSFQGFVSDLEAVVDSLGLERFPLFGMSQGVAVAVEYAARHPERVSALVLYSGGCIGWDAGDPDDPIVRKWDAVERLIEASWGDDNPAIRGMFTSLFVPEASAEQLRDYTECARKSASREVAAGIMRVIGSLDVSGRLQQLTMPTLVMQVSDDAMVPPFATQMLVEAIPGAEFAVLDSRNHILLEAEPAWPAFKAVMSDFLIRHSTAESPQPAAGQVLADLTQRESTILGHMARGQNNASIAEALFISEKTVRNHITHIFSKLGVSSRAEAIVLAKDNGY